MKTQAKKPNALPRLLLALALLAAGIAVLALHFTPPPSAFLSQTDPVAEPGSRAEVTEIDIAQARGYSGDGWTLYFTEPQDESMRDYQGGIDSALADAISQVENTLDIAVFDLDSPTIAQAIRAAHDRGVSVRIVADDEHGLDNPDSELLLDLRAAGIPVVDDGRSALMHNKFMILDGRTVWTGSMNYTVNGAYRHNNNALVLDDPQAAAVFQAEFDEMFARREFGARSTNDGEQTIPLGEGEISVIFAPEGYALPALLREIESARESVHFMTFVFSLEELASAMLRQSHENEVDLRGIFERRSALASWSQLPLLYCAGANMRRDGNYFYLHHKVIIIDERVVITGSFNFSKSATRSNDENLLIIRDETIAGLYMDEWRRLWDSATRVYEGLVDCGD